MSSSYVLSSSYSDNSLSSSYSDNSVSSSYSDNSVSSSYSLSSSYSDNSTSASYLSGAFVSNGGVVSGSLTVTQNLTVLGSSSIVYITSSNLDVATNIITVNTSTPALRFGGLSVIDSGSIPKVSGSLFFDSQEDQWLFVHQGPTTSSILIMGPETYDDQGNETHPTTNRVMKSLNDEHIGDSNITDDGSVVSVNSDTQITGSLIVTSTASFLSQSSFILNTSDPFYVAKNPTIVVSNSPNNTLGVQGALIVGANGSGQSWNRLNNDGTSDFGGGLIHFNNNGSGYFGGNIGIGSLSYSVTNTLNVNGNVNANSYTGSLSGNVYGTSSWSSNVLSASYALSSSRSITSSYALSSSYASGSNVFAISSSYSLNSTSASYSDNSTSASYVLSSSYSSNSALLNNIASTSFATTGSNTFIGNQIITGSFIVTSSYGIISKGGTLTDFTNGVSTSQSIYVWRAPYSCSVVSMYGRRNSTGGTPQVNAARSGSAGYALLTGSNLSLSTANTWSLAGTLSNTNFIPGDGLEIVISGSGNAQIAVQVDFIKSL